MNSSKKTSVRAALLAALLCLSLTACGGGASASTAAAETAPPAENTAVQDSTAGTVTIVHEYGEAEVPVNPQKIVCFDLGLLDVLDSVGIEVGSLPSGVKPAHLSKFAGEGYVNAGSLKEADLEAINEYGPDVILITGRLSSYYEELRKIAPTVYFAMPGSDYIADFQVNVNILAQVFPEKAQAMQAQLSAIDASVAQLRADAQESGLNALVIMANDGSISFFGSGSRYGVIHDTFGFAQADDDIEASTHGQESNFEYIYETNPDIIFVIDRSAAIGADSATGAASLLDNELVNATNAARNGKIVYLSSDVWYLAVGGVQATEIMVAEVAAALA